MSDSDELSSSSSPADKENDSQDSSTGSSSPPNDGGDRSNGKSPPPSGSPPAPDSLPLNSSSSKSPPSPSSSPPPSKESPPPKSDSPPPPSTDTNNLMKSTPPPSKSPENAPPSPEKQAPSSKTPPSPSPPITESTAPPSDNSTSTLLVTGGSKQTPSPPISMSPPPNPLSPPITPSGYGSGSDRVNVPSHDFSPPNYTPSLRPPRNPNSKSADSSSDSNSPPSSSDSSSSSNGNAGTVIGVTVAGVFIIVFIIIFFVIKRKKRVDTYNNNYMPPVGYYSTGQSGNSVGPHSTISSGTGSQRGGMYHTGGGTDSGGIGVSNQHFSYEELMEITNGFSRQNILGEGGFGCVFKGWLSDGKEVAVKQLKAGSGQGEREFRAEVEIISRVHHRHLVSLVGYCLAENHRLLIYEFVPNKTLEYHLHDNEASVLDWPNRLKIALGAAKGLAYLHEDCHPKIIHRDIKTANILLDDFYEAKVADFGLAKLTYDTNTHVSTRVMGTFGYMAPEYASSGKLTDRSDVYSFGVVLLELVTGHIPVDPTQPLGDESLVEWARPLLMHALETGDLSEIIDPRLEKHYVKSEMFRMIEAAAACIRHSAPKRPRMMQVVRALDCVGEHSDLSNGLKYGQSTIYDSGQYNQDIPRFRNIALDSEDSSEYNIYSGDYNSKEYSGPHRLNNAWSSESETGAFKQR